MPDVTPLATRPLTGIVDNSESGVDFADSFDSKLLIEETLKFLSSALYPSPSTVALKYFARRPKSYFMQHHEGFPEDGPDQPHLPVFIDEDVIVPDDRWPLCNRGDGPLSWCRDWCNPGDSVPARFANRVKWHLLIRAEQTGPPRHAGYLQAFGFEDPGTVDDYDLLDVFFRTKLFVESKINEDNLNRIWRKEGFRPLVERTNSVLQTSDWEHALHHLADLLTSHLGAAWNRAALFLPTSPAADTLRCVYAHGGDGSLDWCAVMRVVAEETPEIDDLIRITDHTSGREDAYHEAAAAEANPLEVQNVQDPLNSNLLATLWRLNGDVARLPHHNVHWEASDQPVISEIRPDAPLLRDGEPPAAVFTQDDPWVRQVERERPGAPLFASKNQRYFFVPWFTSGEPRQIVGVWLLDLAYFEPKPEAPLRLPSFLLTHSLLQSTISHFLPHRDHYWTRLGTNPAPP